MKLSINFGGVSVDELSDAELEEAKEKLIEVLGLISDTILRRIIKK
jgi:hypothetical protein